MTRLNYSLTQRLMGAAGAAAIASLVALPSFAETTRISQTGTSTPAEQTSQGAQRAAVTTVDQEFFKLAYQGNNAEIDTSRLALEKSQDQAIRQYAQRMIDEHTRANEVLTQQASEQGFELPSERVDPLDQAIAAQLTQLSGAEFDQAYVGVQANAHLKAIALYRTEVAQGESPDLTAYASQLLPSIEEHYEMANAMLPEYTTGDSQSPADM
ncbi:DUF4142 domain-containing protein [Nodosilinea sp. FACHB-131]|uniref:DUF4142 domain-containing protein n=1 Tax=Cyanophyceae TaxID=3028117 RepID=UPI00168594EB|nr:DUF4142 domain-containing protein [Nodosilinea sp. FACHB-131]MBD1876465.1 DUF4142 domain-containing protein [Nodosilinea sp. FACHB-131]